MRPGGFAGCFRQRKSPLRGTQAKTKLQPPGQALRNRNGESDPLNPRRSRRGACQQAKAVADAHAYRVSHKEEIAAKKRDYYFAHKEEIAAKDHAYRTSHKEEKTAYNRVYSVINKEEKTAYNRSYYAAHKEEDAARSRAYRAIYKEKVAARLRAYNASHKEAIAAKKRAYNAANPAIAKKSRAARRNHKALAPRNDLTHAQWLAIQDAQDHRCAYCGTRCKGHLTQDHITPLSKGGSHTLHNVIGACASCNSKKYTGPPLVPVQPLLL